MTHHTPEHKELAELNLKGQGGSEQSKMANEAYH